MGPRTPQERRRAARRQREVERRAKAREERGVTPADLARAKRENARKVAEINGEESYAGRKRRGPERPSSTYKGGRTS